MKLRRGRSRIIAILFYCFIVFGAAIFLFAKVSYAETSDVIINEIYPNPLVGDANPLNNVEWIELYNTSGQAVDLTGLTLVDDESLSKPAILDKFISMAAGSYLILKKGEDFTFTLSNDDETIFLKRDLDIVAQASYSHSEKGQSNVFFEIGGWQWTTTPTPGDINILTEKNLTGKNPSTDSIDIIAARDESNGTAVTITGTVTVSPDTLSSQYFYIQDATGGMQIYSYYKSFPVLNIGDVIQVSGELSETSGERRLKMGSDTVVNIISHTEPPPPKQVGIKDIVESLEGQYVKISGTVAETSGDTFVVQDNENNQIKIVIKSMTNIEKPKMHKGDQVEISGIVSQYKDEYRILPTKQDDVRIISSAKSALPEAGLPLFFYPIFSFIIISLWNIFQKVKRKLLRSQKKSWPRHLPATFLP